VSSTLGTGLQFFSCITSLPASSIEHVSWILYTGTLIKDLFASVERAEQAAAARSRQRVLSQSMGAKNPEATSADAMNLTNRSSGAAASEPKQFPQSFCLSPADWNLALLLIVHAQLVGTLEPGDDFANTIDVHQVGAVGPPEQARIQAVE
jgi:hypothetical protein